MREIRTKQTLLTYLEAETDLTIVDCGLWFYALWKPQPNRPCIALRADFDAVVTGDGTCRHLCGHDGHSAILAAFGKWLSEAHPDRNVCLLFQPGEETGEGARICCELFRRENIEAVYGLHNIPGFPAGSILLREGTFACASTGLQIDFRGAPSHAAYPENGINPAAAVSELILSLRAKLRQPHRGMVLATVIGIDLGSESYGVSASEGTLRLTVRAEYQDEFDELLTFIDSDLDRLRKAYSLATDIHRMEAFPSTENDSSHVQLLNAAAGHAGIPVISMEEPRRWSEDFGHYLQQRPGVFFGVGAGEDHPQLHTAEYEFNDTIIEAALRLYRELCTGNGNI